MTDTPARDVDAMIAEAVGRVAPDADLTSVGDDDLLTEQLDLDSMDMLGVLEGLQQLSGLTIPERDAPKLATLAGARAYLIARFA